MSDASEGLSHSAAVIRCSELATNGVRGFKSGGAGLKYGKLHVGNDDAHREALVPTCMRAVVGGFEW